MESESAFVAEAVIEASPRTEGDFHRNCVATEAGGGRHRSSESEEAPLLPGWLDGDTDRAEDCSRSAWPSHNDSEGLPWWKRPSIYWMLPPFLLSSLAFGGIIVPKINLILSLICREYFAEQALLDPNFAFTPVIFGEDNPQCRIPEVQSRVAQFTLYGNLIAGLLAAIISPKLGALSDRYGRRPLMVVTISGIVGGEVITLLAAIYPDSFPVNWILVGYAAEGICGSFISMMALAHSYATDCTLPAKRNIVFGLFHGCLFAGVALGPLVAGHIVKQTGSLISVFYVVLAAHAIFIIFLSVIIPESLAKTRQYAARDKYRQERLRTEPNSNWVNQMRRLNLFEPLKILCPTGPGSSPAVRHNLLLLSAVDTIMFGVAMGSFTVVVIYVNYEFGWDTAQSSFFISIISTFRVSCLLVALPLATLYIKGRPSQSSQRHYGSDLFDLTVIRLAVFFDALGYLGYTLSRTAAPFVLSGVVASIGAIGSPTLQSALTKHVPADRTGQLLGATGLLHALARVVAPTIFNAIYSATVGKYTQTVFVCLTATFGVAFLVSWFVKPHVYLDELDAEHVSGVECGE